MSDSSANPSKLSALTVTCHQCGGSSMVRLDRKEYRCTHCGAITVISDDDADRLEQMLTKVLNRPNTSGGTLAAPKVVNIGGMIALGVLAMVVILGFLASLTTHHRPRTYTTSTSRDNTSVPASQVVMSPLQWIPESSLGGNYVGLLYNHSGYTIDAPDYGMTLFHDGMKGDTAIFSGTLRTLQPGEYEHVAFRLLHGTAGDRYEVENPRSIDRSTSELAPAKLDNAQFVHQAGSQRYTLVGVVQNTFTRPINGMGQMLLYDKDQQLIGAGDDAFSNVRPGEKTMMAISVYTQKPDVAIAAYEYLIDAQFADSR